MDLNQLYFDHQILSMRAERLPRGEHRARHAQGAATLAGRIGRFQSALGADASRGWHRAAAGEA